MSPKKEPKDGGTEERESFKQHLTEIGKILEWFDAQEELDIEEALAKVKKAAELIKASRKRLTEIENEFEEIKEEVEEE